MKEDLITLKTAKLAKKKGFDLESLYFYTKPNSKMFGIDEHNRPYSIKNTSKKLYKCGNHAALNIDNVFSAPTQALLQRWLREEHNIHISIGLNLNGDRPKVYWISFEHTLEGSIIDTFQTEYKTYEEALEVGLYEALKLIK
jgi:hypothetical protein